MPDLVRIRHSGAAAPIRIALHLFDLAAYEVLYRFSPVRNHLFFNGGYLPLAADMVACPAVAGEEPNAMMYHLLLRSMVADLDPRPAALVDVGCGQGGGLLYAHCLYPVAELAGTDRNGTVTRLARRNLAGVPGCRFVKGGGKDEIAFADASFDFVLSVGAPTYFGLTRFVAEAARVCRPGGIIAFSGGYRQGEHAVIEAELRAAAQDRGLRFIRYTNITPHTFAALEADIPRRIEKLKRVPWPFRAYGWKWADMPGSAEYEEYVTGKRADFAAVLCKP
ncbi:class I SAM-dependent methyltransferase [Phaeovulum sp.]|uniref:class I SAM-dependent methyltransferase n=1 Tax=Phaeovulum sp. TaxID=2934796 RepID=UPI00272F0596|nr:class I SAM-dependent methyltransferase [Phaeovulum sp.]MDP1667526.1 class I SAM-dependent methyltransferase [Phaeovulum sp.]MDZ4120043.1 class I SAM-dependent methyltransferase [Phaeovulum sp.]